MATRHKFDVKCLPSHLSSKIDPLAVTVKGKTLVMHSCPLYATSLYSLLYTGVNYTLRCFFVITNLLHMLFIDFFNNHTL